MRRNLHQLLQGAGLSEHEIKVYLLLCKYKQATIPELVCRSKIPNISVYRALQNLEEGKLVHSVAINKKQRSYVPNSLATLVESVSRRQRKLRKIEMALRHFSPYLRYFSDEQEDDSVSIFEGQAAFRQEFLRLPSFCENEFLHIGNVDGLWSASGYNYECPEIRSFVHTRMRKNIFARELTVWTPEAERIQKNDGREKRTTVLRKSLPVMRDMLVITKDRVSHFVCTPENPKVISITNPELVSIHKEYFHSLWGQ